MARNAGGRGALILALSGLVAALNGCGGSSLDLSKAQMKITDAPPGYTHAQYATFSQGKAARFPKSLIGAQRCASLISPTAGRQGFVDSISRGGRRYFLECAWLFNNDSGAGSVYRRQANSANARPFHTVYKTKVGDQSTALVKTANPHFLAYAVVFRHGSALIALAYLVTSPKKHPKADISPADFIKLAATLNSRL